MIGAIILAAGKSERMGHAKALLKVGERTFLEMILDSISKSVVDCTIVVLGHEREAIERSLTIPTAVFNPDYEQGMTTSFQTGIRALPASVSGAFLFLVDHPAISSETVNTLAMNFQPDRILLPTFRSRRGHPVLFSKAILDEILALPATSGANTVVWKDPGRVVEVPVEDPGILADIDTPEQYRQLLIGQSNSNVVDR